MLFHSPDFLFVFLPVALAGYFVCARFGKAWMALAWLTAMSLLFYAEWSERFALLLFCSIVINYVLGDALRRNNTWKRPLLTLGIVLNLSALAYCKYANFFLDTIGSDWTLKVILPLGISFFTFEQIAWLVESSRNEVKTDFLRYAAFVTFFPKLIAGPIVRPHELLPQLDDVQTRHPRMENFSVGITMFSIGLFKKAVIADALAPIADTMFRAASDGDVTSVGAWTGVVAFALQIYFDFSGYTDMALGVARMFGLKLPLNFDAPYQSLSIIDFWRRWHMSLSRLIRDYVYIPLGGSKRGTTRRYLNLFITMALCGLWHGAGWTFVVWGAMHGVFLIVNHLWRSVRKAFGLGTTSTWWSRSIAWAVTMISVLIAWAFFRAEDMASAWTILQSMVGLGSGTSIPLTIFATPAEFWLVILGAGVLLLPTTQQFLRSYAPAYEEEIAERGVVRMRWKPSITTAFATSVLFVTAVFVSVVSTRTEFIYFQF